MLGSIIELIEKIPHIIPIVLNKSVQYVHMRVCIIFSFVYSTCAIIIPPNFFISNSFYPNYSLSLLSNNPPTNNFKTLPTTKNLARRVLLIIILHLLNSRISPHNIVNNSTCQTHSQSLGGTNDQSTKWGHGANSTLGTTGDGARSVEERVAVDEPFGLTEERGWS